MTIESSLQSIIQLMVSPNPEDPLNSVAANMMEKSPEEFKKFARSYKK